MQSTVKSPPSDLGYAVRDLGWNKKRAKFLLILYGAMLPISLFLALLIIGIPAAITNLWLVIRSIRRLRSSQVVLSLHQKGFIDHRQGKATLVRYEDIAKLYISAEQVAMGQSFYRYTLRTRNGIQLKLGLEIADTKQLGTLLQEGMVVNQLPSQLAALTQGASIPFDRLSLTADGLSLRKKQLTWQSFDYAGIQPISWGKSKTHFLDIYQKGQSDFWARFQRNNFPNIALFFALVEHFRQ